MTSFSLDPAAVDRIRARVGGSRPKSSDPTSADPDGPAGGGAGASAGATSDLPVEGWFEGDDLSSRVRSFSRRLVAPAERRFRAEVERAVERHESGLREEVEELRGELLRTRAAHDAELAALNEQLRGRS